MYKNAINPVDLILDPDNEDNIILYNEKDEPMEFEQIAVIPIDEKIYVILKPVDFVEGVGEDEALAFELIKQDKEDIVQLVEEDELIDRIFQEYRDLYNSQQ